MRRNSRSEMLRSAADNPVRTRLACVATLVAFPLLVLASVFWDGAKNITLYDIREGFATLVATAFLPWVD